MGNLIEKHYDGNNAKILADWRESINQKWPGVKVRRLDSSLKTIKQGAEFRIKVGIKLNGLDSDDVHVECLLGQASESNEVEFSSCHLLEAIDSKKDETIYELKFTPANSGLIGYKLRAYPYHRFLCHHLETGFMKWV